MPAFHIQAADFDDGFRANALSLRHLWVIGVMARFLTQGVFRNGGLWGEGFSNTIYIAAGVQARRARRVRYPFLS